MDGRSWWAIFVSIICTIAVVIAGLMYTRQVARDVSQDSERKWCGVVVTMDNAYATPRPPGSPPLTATGQRLLDEMKRLRREFGCD